MMIKCRLIKADGRWLRKMNRARRLMDTCSRMPLHCPHGVDAKWLKRVMKEGKLFLMCEVVQ